jgi:chromosome segregation ATPase
MNTQPTPISDRIVSQFRKGEAHSDGLILTMVDLENQLAAVTEQRDVALEDLAGLNEEYGTWWAQKRIALDELKDVTEQRDRLAEVIEQLKSQLTQTRGAVTISRNGYVQELEQQRDTLAVALRECREDSVELLGERDWWQRESRLDYQERYQETRDNVTRADEALQSLTAKP